MDLSRFERRAKPKLIRCWFGKLTPEQQAEVLAAKAAKHTQETIALVVEEDFKVHCGESSVSNHFTGKCSCD